METDNTRKPEKDQIYRIIDLHSPLKYISNKIDTTSFTILNIIPKTILIELQNIPYLWFVLIIVIDFSSYNNNTSLK